MRNLESHTPDNKKIRAFKKSNFQLLFKGPFSLVWGLFKCFVYVLCAHLACVCAPWHTGGRQRTAFRVESHLPFSWNRVSLVSLLCCVLQASWPASLRCLHLPSLRALGLQGQATAFNLVWVPGLEDGLTGLFDKWFLPTDLYLHFPILEDNLDMIRI